MKKNKYYISTAIAYTSGKPHIGNTYEVVLADSIARFKRFEGYDVYFQTGTDEHGQKIEEKAKSFGKSSKDFVDEIAYEIKRIYDIMNTSYDKFVRTTDKSHISRVQGIFKKLYNQGDIYKGVYEGLYCTPCESFFTESQAEDGLCPDCATKLISAKEEAYFLKLSKYEERLKKHINENPEFIYPLSRKNEMMNNFLNKGLSDLCVSRTSFKWGIPVDFDDKHVVYVWIDALSNYITFLDYDVENPNSEMMTKYWPCDLHLIGKDILRFHTIYWPIILMALGVELPKQVFGHPWLLTNKNKMSKSKGNVLYADHLVDVFSVDAVRYFLLHEIPYEHDGDITPELLVERINSDLVNTLGNLVNRTLTMIQKTGGIIRKGKKENIDIEYRQYVIDNVRKTIEKMNELKVSDAITAIFDIFRRSNKYIDETTPWILMKDENSKERLDEVFKNLSESIIIGSSLLYSFMPDTAENISKYFNINLLNIDELEKIDFINEHKINDKFSILFERLDENEKLEELNKYFDSLKTNIIENNSKEEKNVEKEEISIDDFDKVDLKIGEIIECEKVKKSKKLLVSKVKIGNEIRQIVSGIASYYSPEEMIGKKVVVVTNLKPVKLCGILSEGMILAANTDDKLSIITLDRELGNGAIVK